MKTVFKELVEKIKPVIADTGCAFWGLEYLSGAKPPILRIYIDSLKGINVDQCAQVSREVNGLLDVENPISGEYNLEVSSPGIDRLFFYPEQFKEHIGERIKVKLNAPIEGASRWRATLTDVDEQGITFTDGGQICKVNFDMIEKARLVPS